MDDVLVRRLVAAPDDAVPVLEDAGELTQDSLQVLVDEAGQMVASDPHAALTVLDIAEAVAGRVPPGPALPMARYVRARLTLEAGNPLDALSLIASARQAFEGLGMAAEALRTELGRMHALDDLGRHLEAADVGRALLAAADALQRADPGDAAMRQLRGRALINLGAALGFVGDHEAALWSYLRAEVLWRGPGDTEAAAVARANQAIELLALGRAADALTRLDGSVGVLEASDDRFWFAKCLGHRAEALTALGRYDAALDDLRVASQTLQLLGARTEAWRTQTEVASVLLHLGLPDEVVVVLEDVIPALRTAGIQHDLASALLVQGSALARLGRAAPAERVLSEAARVLADVGNDADRAGALLELSRVQSSPAALHTAQEAAELVDPDRRPGIACLLALRLAELQAAEPDLAEAHVDDAAAIVDRRPLPHLRHAVDLARGMLLVDQGKLDSGIAFLSRSLLEAERVEIGIKDHVMRAAYAAGLTRATDDLVAALLERGGPGDIALAAVRSDTSKAGALADAQRGAGPGRRRIGKRSGDAASELLDELQAAYSSVFTGPAAGDEALYRRIDTLERRITAADTLEARTARPTARAPQATLPPNVPSVAYHVLGDEVTAFVTINGQVHVRRRVTDVRYLTRLLDDLEAHLGAHAVPLLAAHAGARIGACRAVLQRLYLAVLAPVADLLPRPAGPHRPLVVIPHGVLHRVPFQALHDGRAYLVERYAVTLGPSLEVVAGAMDRPIRRGPALVMGHADETTPCVEDEALQVARASGAGAWLFVGAEATFDRLCENASRAALVHLACHGLFRSGNPAFTSLRLADRWVRAADVADLDLVGASLVLSACETGRPGEDSGAAALAQGFLASGARSVIVSGWLADDRTTAHLMVHLHRRLAAGDDPPTALRAAQLAILADHPHPFYWAPFVAVGAPSSDRKD